MVLYVSQLRRILLFNGRYLDNTCIAFVVLCQTRVFVCCAPEKTYISSGLFGAGCHVASHCIASHSRRKVGQGVRAVACNVGARATPDRDPDLC